MKIAITGATGFIGKYMLRGLAANGHSVRAMVRPGREDALDVPEGLDLEVFTGDLLKPESMQGFLEGTEMILHFASAHDHFSDEEMRAINIDGTEVLIREAKKAESMLPGRQKFQFWIISSAVIGAPVYSYYRDTKRIQEKLVRASQLDWVSFRPTLVYGIGDDRHTAPLLQRCAAKSGSYWVPHDGKSKINPVHVEDVVEAIIRYFDFERGVDCCYELAGPEGIPFNEFVDLTIAAVGGGIKRRNIPKKWADRFIFLKGLFTDVTEARRASAYFNLHHQHDISNAVDELGWKPRTYSEGLAEVSQGDWWREGGA